jgi:putative solute:sodium symporter small subunit
MEPAGFKPKPGRHKAIKVFFINEEEDNVQPSAKMQEYWRKNLKLTAVLLAIWFVVSYVMAFYADALNNFTFLGFPLGFYLAAQGALVVYVVVIAFYAWRMNRMDREYDVHEE